MTYGPVVPFTVSEKKMNAGLARKYLRQESSDQSNC